MDNREILEGIKIEIERLRLDLNEPQYLNKSKIARLWDYSCQSQIKKWQLPNFGIPTHFKGRSPMYKRSEVIDILNNPIPYKEKWMRLTVKDKIKIQDDYESQKRRDEALAC